MRPLSFRLVLAAFAAVLIGTALVVACGGGGGGGGGPTAPPAPGPQSFTVEIRDDAFVPRSVHVQPGDTVVWVYRGSHSGHTVIEAAGVWNSGEVFHNAGDSFAHTFGTSDGGKTYLYYCRTHQGCCQMQGSVQVGDNAPRPSPGYE